MGFDDSVIYTEDVWLYLEFWPEPEIITKWIYFCPQVKMWGDPYLYGPIKGADLNNLSLTIKTCHLSPCFTWHLLRHWHKFNLF